MVLTPLTVTLIVFGIVTIILIGWIVRLELKVRNLLLGSGSKNLEDTFKHIAVSIKDLETFRAELEDYLTLVEQRLRQSIQGVHTVRFNPFKGTGGGGNQSFATALLNEDGDGVIISSLYSRDHVSVFSKPIKKLTSEFELSDEEKQALDTARITISKNTKK